MRAKTVQSRPPEKSTATRAGATDWDGGKGTPWERRDNDHWRRWKRSLTAGECCVRAEDEWPCISLLNFGNGER